MYPIETLYQDVLTLAKRPDANFLQLARGLVELRSRLPKRVRDLIKQSGLKERRAYYLLQMAEHLSRLETQGVRFEEDQLHRIGPVKLRFIAQHLTPTNADEWLQLAERKTIRELVARVQGENATSKEHVVVLHFTPEQYQIFAEAILQNGAIRNPSRRVLQNKEEAILRIIGQSRQSGPERDLIITAPASHLNG